MMKRVHLSNTKKLFDFPDHFSNAFNTWVLPPSTVSVAVRGKRCTRPRLIDVKSTMGWTEALGQ